jgi:cbb3-type cytochrome oxidase subunit 1
VTIPLGLTQSKEYGEPEWFVDLPIAVKGAQKDRMDLAFSVCVVQAFNKLFFWPRS